MNNQIAIFLFVCFFYPSVVHAQTDHSKAVLTKSKAEMLNSLDSLSHTLTENNFTTYIELIQFSLDSISEDNAIKHLLLALKAPNKKDNQTPHILYLLVEEYYSKLAYDSAILYADRMLDLFENADRKELALALEVKASSLLRTERVEELNLLLIEYETFLKEEFPNNYLFIFDMILYSYLTSSKYDEVIERGREGLNFAQKVEDYRNAILIQNRIAAAHKNNKNFETARDYLMKSVQILQAHPDQISEVYTNYNLGMLYRDMNELDSAIIYTSRSLALLDPKLRNNYFPQLVTLYADNSQFNEAIQVLDSIDTSLLIDHTARGEYLSAKGITHAGLGNYKTAIESLDSALLIRTAQPREVARLKYALSSIHHKMAEDSKALALYQQADAIEDSLFAIEKQEVIIDLESQYQLSEKEKEILKLASDSARERGILIGTIGLAVLISIIAFLAYRAYRIKHKSNQELSIKNQHLKALRVREKQLSEAAISAKEREMTTMAMATHEKNALLKSLEQKVPAIEKSMGEELKQTLKEMKKIISSSYALDESWDSFLHRFEDVHPKFFDALKKENPNLTIDDLKLSAYLKIGMNNKEIANVTHLTLGSVKSKINRLKKKLQMQPEDNIRDIILANN